MYLNGKNISKELVYSKRKRDELQTENANVRYNA